MIIQSRNVWLHEQLVPAEIELEDGTIKGIHDYGSASADVDYEDKWILPGFIDIHTHGWNKADAGHPDKAAMNRWRRHMPAEGVTSFLATTATQSRTENEAAFAVLGDVIDTQKKGEGAEILGIHVEGNYISFTCRGAQDPYNIVKPDPDELLHYDELSHHHICTVICAPECEGAEHFIPEVTGHGIRVGLGHSAADYNTGMKGVEWGATSTVHTGNGMLPFHHRRPGLFGAALCNPDLYCEIIGDGHHVAFPTAHIIGTMKGKDRLMLVTDSLPLKDDPAYDYMCHDGAYMLADGTLCGSHLYVNQGVYNLHRRADLPLVTAINAATINPARYLGFDNRKGSIEEGKDADLVVTDPDLKVCATYCAGVLQEDQ